MLEGVGSNANISLTADGRELGRYGHSTRISADEKVGANSASGDCRKNVHLPRQALRRVLLERLSPETIHWGKKFKNYNETMCSSSPGVELQFEDGEHSPRCFPNVALPERTGTHVLARLIQFGGNGEKLLVKARMVPYFWA